MQTELFAKMDELYASMSKGQKRIADYIKDNPEQASYMTAAKLGHAVSVSESTVVRFAGSLGYGGYPELQKALREVIRSRLDNMQTVGLTYGQRSQSEIIDAVLKSDIERIADTLSLLNPEAFDATCELIANARNIYIIGIRQDAPLASFLAFYLNMMFGNARLIQTTSVSEIFEQMISIGSDDVLVGIGFPRYSMRTLKAMEFANNRNACVISITDSAHSPMNLYSSCNLFARSDSVSIVDSLVAPLSLINALVVSLCIKKQDDVSRNLKIIEDAWSDFQVYGQDEIDFLDDDRIRGNDG